MCLYQAHHQVFATTFGVLEKISSDGGPEFTADENELFSLLKVLNVVYF